MEGYIQDLIHVDLCLNETCSICLTNSLLKSQSQPDMVEIFHKIFERSPTKEPNYNNITARMKSLTATRCLPKDTLSDYYSREIFQKEKKICFQYVNFYSKLIGWTNKTLKRANVFAKYRHFGY